MKYVYNEPGDMKGVWKDLSGQEWGYGDKKGEVVAEVRKKATTKNDAYLETKDHQIPVDPPRKRRKLFEKTVGYLPCTAEGEEACIRIMVPSYGRIFSAILVIVLLCGAVVFGINRLISSNYPQDEVIDVKLPDSMKNTDSDSYSIPDYTLIRKNAANAKTDTWLFNVEGNPYDLAYEIYLEEDHKLIYGSPILRSGEGIEGMTLYEDLPAGEYEYTLECKIYEKDSKTEIGVQSFEGVLEVYEE